MAKPSLSVENLDEVRNLLRDAKAATTESALRKAIAAGTTVFKQEVELRAPRRSGDLARGVTVAYVPEESVSGKVATYVVTFIGRARNLKNGRPGMRLADVARWLEYGTSKMAASPFIRPAFDAKKEQALDTAEAKLLEVLKSGG
ncbi:hypothetical protein R6138_01889 [Ralstonia thomasii]|uniref:HK97-gp10 family putative phage morphogenesis protein n=1 Tax=Ralstonia thomasii TaxID=3058596 RepID=UPI0028F5E472|nr:HK97-gp10 family putative phage morphogenesis protein [Ralstonia sp. LMG 18095]CAJ0872991.1 hypothetical protein R6138_01889 [Ralstonia sp. LMG 18095]